jgi:8-oxo-dGTP diphosphatase
MRKGRLLLVARERGRWAMPGGRPKSDEALSCAAFRELREETGLPAVSVRYAFQFFGASTRHFVFVADLPHGAQPSPSSEIARFCWARLKDIKRMPASIPTKGIADLLLRARPLVERTAGSALHATGGIASRMARARHPCTPPAPSAVSAISPAASGDSGQATPLPGPRQAVSQPRPDDGQPSAESAAPTAEAIAPASDRAAQAAADDARKPSPRRRHLAPRGDR